MDDIRDRLARAEQDIKNHKENFHSFKSEDFGALKTEVHVMRGEFNKKLDELIEKLNGINLTLAKWMGAGAVLIFVGQLIVKKLVG